MKKVFKISLVIALCLAMLVPTVASAISTSYAPYEAYEYNSYKESVAAPVGYLFEESKKGSDFEFSVDIKSVTDLSYDAHDSDHPALFLLDGKAGIIYKTDIELNVITVFDSFTNTNGKKVTLSGAKYIANDFSNSYFYVVKGTKVYVINALSTVEKVFDVGEVVAFTSIGVAGTDTYDSYIAVVTSQNKDSVVLYNNKGKKVATQKVGGSVDALHYNLESTFLYTLDANAKKVTQMTLVTDFDDDGNTIPTGFDKEFGTVYKVKADLSSANSISVDALDEKVYISLKNKILCYDTFEDDVTYINGNNIPVNVKDVKTNYSTIKVVGEANTLYCLSSGSKPNVDVYNANHGYTKSIDTLSVTLNAPTDIKYQNGKYIYLLDSGNSRILKLDKSLTRIIDIFSTVYDKDLGYLTYYGANGVTIDENENFYLADTENYRVIITNNKGQVINIITRPDEQLADTDAPFRATKVLLDRKGLIYVICDSINLGAFVYDTNYEFKSFYGSNTVVATAEVLLDFVRKQFLTREQLNATRKTTPITLANFDIDENGFIYTVTLTPNTQLNRTFTGMVRKLNFQDDDIFTLNDNSVGFGDYEWDRQNTVTNTSFNDVDVDDDGYINLIDSGRGKVFQYSEDGNLVTVFGGYSNQVGTFKEPVAIESVDNKILVVDKMLNNITIFTPTEYTKALRRAYTYLDSSETDKAIEAWDDVLKYNTNSEYPYYGMGRAYEMKGDYENAMKYYKLSNSKGAYSKAYQEYRKAYVSENIIWIVLILIAIFVIAFIVVRYIKKLTVSKHGEAYSPLETKWGLPIYVLMHPVDGFEQFRNRNMHSIPIAIGIVITWFLVKVLEFFLTGFAFNNNRPVDYDLLANVIGTIGLFVLFIIANWAICTLLNGKGRMKDIVCVTAYAITPMLLTIFINIILSNVLAIEEASFITIISMLGYLWAAIVLLLGLYTIHQYSFGGTVGSVLLTILGMAVIGLLLILFFTLLQQCFMFIGSVIAELKLR